MAFKEIIMRYLVLFAIIFCCFSCSKSHEKESISLIPLPANMIGGAGHFTINSKTIIVASGEALETAGYFQDFFKQHSGMELKISEIGHDNAIYLSLDEKFENPEGYSLSVDKNGVNISATTSAGLFYGIQTLRQLLPAQIESLHPVQRTRWTVPYVTIEDQPAYEWRGFMLDCSRHIFPVEFIKKLIDQMAARKLNTFHWHFTDAQGWRIEIKKYPKLTEIAAWRVNREGEKWTEIIPPQPGEKADYGGFYTQEQVRDIIDYAKSRHITIIPEIEMPSHCASVFAAYPQFSCSGKKIDVPPGRANIADLFSTMPGLNIPPDEQISPLLCAGNDSVYIFIEDVLAEIMELFPSEYIHIGCDEVNKRAWKICPKCQRKIHTENLDDEEDLMLYFIRHVEAFINSKGRKPILWYEEEFANRGIDTTTAVIYWRIKDLHDLTALEKGHPVVMAPSSHTYFNAYQGPFHMEPYSPGNYISLEKAYSFNPIFSRLTGKETGHILGGQACLWTESIETTKQVEYMLFPRFEALSEVLWTPESKKDLVDFKQRMVKQIERYVHNDISFSKSALLVHPEVSYNKSKETMQVKLFSELELGDISYSIDGSEPVEQGLFYKSPFELKNGATIKAVQTKNRKPLSLVTNNEICMNKAVGGKIIYGQSSNYPYSGKNDFNQLINGIKASSDTWDWEWIGFSKNKTIHFTIELENPIKIDSMMIGFLRSPDDDVYQPDIVEYFVSDDGVTYIKVSEVIAPKENTEENTIYRYPAEIDKIAGFVKIVARSRDKGLVDKKVTWMMADEIIVL